MERGRREGKEPIVERGRREEELDEHTEMESLIKETDGLKLSEKSETSSSSSSSNISSSLSPESRIERVEDLDEDQLFYNSQQLIMMDEENTSTPPPHQSVETLDDEQEEIEQIQQQPEFDPRHQNQVPLDVSYQHLFGFQPMLSEFDYEVQQLWVNPPPLPQLWVYHPLPPQLWVYHPLPPQFWVNPPHAGTGFFHPPPPQFWVNPPHAGTGFFHPRQAENRVPQEPSNGYSRGRGGAATGGRRGNYRAGSRPPLGRAAARSNSNRHSRSWRPRRGC